MEAKAKTRKLDLDKKEDINMLCTELMLIDPSGQMIVQLEKVILVHGVMGVLKGTAKDGDSANLALPMYLKTLRMQRQMHIDLIAGIERVIQILEEGI